MSDNSPITSPDELANLSVKGPFSWGLPKRVTIETDGIAGGTARAWEEKLSRLQGACGCEQGGMGLLIGTVGCALYLVGRHGGFGPFDNADLVVCVAALFASTSAGKIIGLRIAQHELQKAAREVRAKWVARTSTSGRHDALHGVADRHDASSRCCGRSSVPMSRR